MGNIVIVDLDGTLANGEHRVHHLRKEERDWDAYYEDVLLDEPHPEMVDLVNAIADDYLIVILTGRREETRAETEEWLGNHEVTYHVLIMRPEGNRVDDNVWKLSVGKLMGYHNIAFVVEDRNRIVEAWRTAGVRCIQVADGNF